MEKLNGLKKRLEAIGYTAKVFDSGDQAKEYLLSVISPEESVGIGGSMTVKELELDQALASRGNAVYWHWGVSAQEADQARKQAACADTYLCSANAILPDGRIINIDGMGNRLAATLYGTGRVFMIIGTNKLAEDFDSAMDRIKNVSCPLNAKRLNLKTPCAALGRCTDCSSPQRMCHATLIFDRKPNAHPIEILLVNQTLGY